MQVAAAPPSADVGGGPRMAVVEYVDSENRGRTLDRDVAQLGHLALYLQVFPPSARPCVCGSRCGDKLAWPTSGAPVQSFAEMATLMGLCTSGPGPTLYGKGPLPFIAACTDGEYAQRKPYPCGHSLSNGVACRSGHCASTFTECVHHDYLEAWRPLIPPPSPPTDEADSDV